MRIAPAVAQAAAESGVAARPIADMDAYREKLQTFVYASGTAMRPIFSLAKAAAKKRVAFAEGEEERVLRAVQVVVDENLARPTLIGRPEVIAQRIAKFGLRLVAERDYDLVNTENDHRFRAYWQTLSPADRAQGRDRAARQDRDAAAADPDRLDAAEDRRSRRHALRHLGHDGDAPALHRSGDRPARRCEDVCLHERADPAGPPGDARRHARQLRPDRRAAGRDHGHGRRGDDALRPAAEGGAALAQQLRLEQPALGGEDARGAGARCGRTRPGSRSTARCTATPRSTRTTGTN